jgi:hypothetical protein
MLRLLADLWWLIAILAIYLILLGLCFNWTWLPNLALRVCRPYRTGYRAGWDDATARAHREMAATHQEIDRANAVMRTVMADMANRSAAEWLAAQSRREDAR